MNQFIYRKQLIEKLGLGDSLISPMTTKALVLQSLDSKVGYATSYNKDVVFAICVGGQLLRLGVSFRHVNMLLVELSAKMVGGFFESVRKEKKVLTVFPPSYEGTFKTYEGQKTFLVDEAQTQSIAKSGRNVRLSPATLAPTITRVDDTYYLNGKDLVTGESVSLAFKTKSRNLRIAPLVSIITKEKGGKMSEKPYVNAVDSFITVRLHHIVEAIDKAFE